MKRLTCLLLVFLLLLSTASAAYAVSPEASASPAESEAVSAPLQSEAAISLDATEPTAFTEPGNPEDPGDPVEPEEPEDPADPAEPIEPQPRADELHKPFISGMPDGSFRPNESITRAQLAVILYALDDYEPGSKCFTDVRSNSWYAAAVNALAAAGVVSGYADGSFHPNATATRAELVTILAALSGESCTGSPSFSDVSPRHWANNAIALAQEKGWVSGYDDGSFRPSNPVTRAETVTILNRFLGRTPDSEAIAADENLRFFPDVRKRNWFYAAVMEAATTHSASFDADGTEHWYDMESGDPTSIPDGFYCFDGRLYIVENGSYVRSAAEKTLNGIHYRCEGASGVCKAQTELLSLADGKLLLLKNGKPLHTPGSYPDGFYLKAGHLFVAEDGFIQNVKRSGSCEGVDYCCSGASGYCSVEDWTLLRLNGIDLSVFTDSLTPDATASGSNAVTIAEALRAAVRVYEAYFRVEYPVSSDKTQDYVDRALEYGILETTLSDYNQTVKRGELAAYLWRALHGRALESINVIPELPDVDKDASCYRFVLELYRAGVMTGSEETHHACISDPVTVTELATLLTRLEQPGKRVSFTISTKVLNTIQYGTSGSGKYPLTAYQIGDGKNVMVLSFALHGWEDNWDRDGKALVYIADQLNSFLDEHYDLVRDGNWTVYILRCLNPDGLYLGNTCNGPGRCTTTYYDANGQLMSNKGIDMNRCFPYNYRSFTSNRNFNGSGPLACVEAKAVADFVSTVKGSGHNILIDTHGWFSQIITSSGKGSIYNAFLKQFPGNSYASLSGGSGYFSSWAAYVKGYDSCLLELPNGLTSYNAFLSSGYAARFNAAIQNLLQHYNGPNSTKSTASTDISFEETAPELDGN